MACLPCSDSDRELLPGAGLPARPQTAQPKESARIPGRCSLLLRRKALSEELGRCPPPAMLAPALLCAHLLLAAPASRAQDEPGPGAAAAAAAQLSDMHDKVTAIWQQLVQRAAEPGAPGSALHAACRVQPSASLDAAQPRVSGLVLFRQAAPGAPLEAFFHLDGFPAERNGSRRAIHVHRFGDLSPGCEAAGPHYNPRAAPHPQHPGDFGNFAVRDGRVRKHRGGLAASLAGPHSIVGRAVVVHAGEDDLGRGGDPASLDHGNAGRRLACCVVGVCGPLPWARAAREHAERRKRRRDSDCQAA
ncbi:Extracellular superoxide dismutase [Cu-Zn] [Vulpes lagopus]|uniref:extracellular superoxide dismutase [Cu-Zn] isoform X1 n=1 Tax=Vulpes lagopus TaxID=494514 RepID=UPI001BC9D9AA|nr:extracellular superoxide dismutase [Cu-Zn] isoform X1 [Vulpes lagopus]XP_041606949.1 extracellular superoxide dismutase [Cu-Zn] isoform X1 [Vulpes lagopus]